jgi:hypothetical protein
VQLQELAAHFPKEKKDNSIFNPFKYKKKERERKA